MSELSAFERWWLDAWPHRLQIRHHIPKFLRACPQPFRGEVLEVGAGSGWTSRQILETFPQVELTATDRDPRAVNRLTERAVKYGRRLNVKQADVAALPFDRNSFDMVIAVHMLHHVDDLTVAIREFLRVLRPGGLIGIADENQHYVVGPLRWIWSARNRTSPTEIKHLLESEGVTVMRLEGDAHFMLWAQESYEHVS